MLRDYQKKLVDEAKIILFEKNLVYLSLEMRVGKTIIALELAKQSQATKVLFITVKKAISSIRGDYEREGYGYELTVTNYEQAVKLKPIYDFIIIDEAHKLGAFPKPAKRTVALKQLCGRNKVVYCSGTPNPETETQLFHQFWVSDWSPFGSSTFYKWAKDYVNVKEVTRNGVRFNDYSSARKADIHKVVDCYFVSFTQKDAGFKQAEVSETVVPVQINPNIDKLVKILLKEKYYKFKDGKEIVCDSAVKLQSKIHQIYSGTVKTECGAYKVLDTSKADYIFDNYAGCRIAIFYKFVGEGEVLKSKIKNWTDNPDEFNSSNDKVFICQISSGSMGVNLSKAEMLLFYNIDFSSVQYWQARARLSTLDRQSQPKVHWLFSTTGIERKIYERVLAKKDYTLYYFNRDFIDARGKATSEDNQVLSKSGLLRHQDCRIQSKRYS